MANKQAERMDNASVAGPSTPVIVEPRTRLIIMAGLEGTLEACGCDSQQQTSIDRLAAAVAAARVPERPSLVIAIDRLFTSISDQRPARAQDGLSAELLSELLPRMGVTVAAPALSDYLSAGARLAALRSAGVSVLAPQALGSRGGAPELPRSVLRRVGSLSVGIVNAADDAQQSVLSDELRALRAAGAQLTLAVMSASHQALVSPSKQASAPDIILVPAGDHSKPSALPINGDSKLLSAPEHAEGLLLIDVDAADPSSEDAGLRVHASTIRLTAESPRDPFVRSELIRLFERINSTNLRLDLGTEQVAASERHYVGSDTCAACHTRTYIWWRETSHAQALRSLEQRGRQHDLDCIGCHVTGFQQPGGATLSSQEHLNGVGCESCHGPGSAHSNDPTRANSIEISVAEEVCTRCHDSRHSNAFNFRSDRERLITAAHGGS